MIRSSRLSDSILREGRWPFCYDPLPWWRLWFSTWYRWILADSTLLARRLPVFSIFAFVSVRLWFPVVVGGGVVDILIFLRIRRGLCHDFVGEGQDTTVNLMKVTSDRTILTSEDAQPLNNLIYEVCACPGFICVRC